VHGVNWEHLKTAGRNGTLVVESNYRKSDALIRDSLAIFDMSPNTVTGMHDRQMRAAAAQTLCVTNRQPLLNQLFPDAELFTYDFNRESLRQKVEWMLAHRSETVELGVACAGKFDETFTMEKTFFQLDSIADMVRQNFSTEPPAGAPNYLSWPPKELKNRYVPPEIPPEHRVRPPAVSSEERSWVRRMLSKA
ncbi:MAG TPA: glycosyltransferase, partial [Burkholderiaceae bacterium]